MVENTSAEILPGTKHRAVKKLYATAQSRAIRTLVNTHFTEYQTYYRQECAKLGLQNRPTKAERLAKLRQQIREIEESAGV